MLDVVLLNVVAPDPIPLLELKTKVCPWFNLIPGHVQKPKCEELRSTLPSLVEKCWHNFKRGPNILACVFVRIFRAYIIGNLSLTHDPKRYTEPLTLYEPAPQPPPPEVKPSLDQSDP